MPRNTWELPGDRRIFVFALAISFLLHVFAYIGTPFMALALIEPSEIRFDAILIPAKELAASAITEQTLPVKRIAPARKKVAAPPATPKSAADFAAPENAIAVERNDGEVASTTAGESDAGVPAAAVTPAAAADLTSTAPPAIVPAAEVVPETPVTAKETSPPEFPSRISIAYKATSAITDGVADYVWRRDGNRYEIDSTIQATGFVVGRLLGTMHQVSKGEITAKGLVPTSFSFRRGEGEADLADFASATKELRFTKSGQTRTVPLPDLIQDTQSFLFQLAYDAPRLKSPDDRLEVMVTNARKVYRHRFKLVGKETIDTRMGKVETVHLLSEAADPEDAYEVWLAPEHLHLPVKFKFFVGRFPLELIAASIRSTP